MTSPIGWQLAYTASLFHQDDDAGVRSYLRDPSGTTVYAGNSNINGYNYNIAASTFSNHVYNYQQTQLAQGLSLKSGTDGDFAWEIVASDYAYLNDKQRVPTAALPGAFTSGAGTINRMNGTGWYHAGCQWRLARLGGSCNVVRPAPRCRDLRPDPKQPRRLDRRRHRHGGERRQGPHRHQCRLAAGYLDHCARPQSGAGRAL